MSRNASRRRSPLLAVLLLLLVAVVPQRGAAQEGEPVTLRVWDQFTGPESDVVDQIYQGFSDQNPNVTIERESFGTDEMRQTLNTALGSGTGPDVILYDPGPGYAGVLVDAGLLQPLDALADQYGWRERITASALEGTSLGGRLYGLPLTTDIIGLYYNRTLMTEAGFEVPQTIEQLVTFCAAAAEQGYIPIAFGDQEGWPAFHQFSMMSNQTLGADAMRQLLYENQGRWDSPEIVAAISTFFVELREAGCFGDDVNALTYEDANGLFYSGEALMTPTGSWLANDIVANMPDQEVGIVPFPAISGGQGQIWPAGVGSAYFVSAQSEHPTEAGALLDYLVSPETASRWVGEARFFVPIEVDTTGLDISPLAQSILDVLAAAGAGEAQLGYNVDVLAPPAFNDAMLNGFQSILAEDETPENLAAELQAAWEEGLRATPEA